MRWCGAIPGHRCRISGTRCRRPTPVSGAPGLHGGAFRHAVLSRHAGGVHVGVQCVHGCQVVHRSRSQVHHLALYARDCDLRWQFTRACGTFPESPSTTAVMSFPSLYMGIPIFQPLYVTLAPCPRQRPHSCELFRPSHRLHAYKSSVPSASSVSSANLRKKRQMDASNRPFYARIDLRTWGQTHAINCPLYAEIPFRRRPGAGWNAEGAAEAIEASAAPYGVCSWVRLSP